jgi:thiol-disulfide isomerase/thioredoxin
MKAAKLQQGRCEGCGLLVFEQDRKFSYVTIHTSREQGMNQYHLGGASRFKKAAVPLLVGTLLILGCVEPGDSSVGSSIELPSEPIQWLPEEERQPMDLSGTFKTLEDEDSPLLDPDAEGNLVFLNLWATWCGPCLAEMPAMASLYEELSGRGFSMVAVSDEDPETVREFLEESPYPFTILLDPENVLGQRFEVMALPSTFIIDREGRLALRQTGAYHWNAADILEQFEPLLATD